MDETGKFWYFSAMPTSQPPDLAPQKIPAWQLYGESNAFPDLLHIERIIDRAAGLDWRIAPHRHLHLHQFFLIAQGHMRLTLDGRESLPALPALVNVPSGVVHGITFAAGTEGYVLTMPTGDFPEVFGPDAAPFAALSRPFIAPAPAAMAAEFARIAALHARIGALRQLRLRAAALALCCNAAECGPPAETAAQNDPRIARFEALVLGDLAQQHPISAYAKSLGLSERHLRRLCLTTHGQPAQAFAEAIRLREARRLLAYTRMRVAEVGYALGYDDPAYFTSAFRRATGLSPAQYRHSLEGPRAP